MAAAGEFYAQDSKMRNSMSAQGEYEQPTDVFDWCWANMDLNGKQKREDSL